MFIKEFGERALKLGFIAVGFSRPNTPLHFEKFKNGSIDSKWGI